MAGSYKLIRDLVFDPTTGYWNLTVRVSSSTNVSPRPFLLEKAVLGTESSNSLATSNEPPRYLRTLLATETATSRTENDNTQYTSFTWVTYRSNQFTKQFYTYAQAAEAMGAIEAVLKSNANAFPRGTRTVPRIIATNLSAKEKKPVLDNLVVTKGDAISLQLIGGTGETTVTTDGGLIPVSGAIKSPSHLLTVTDSSNLTYVGLIDTATGKEHQVQVFINETPLEGSGEEIVIQ